MYFKNYAQNKFGEPTKGYRSSTQFTSKQATHDLRKLFANIINDKFQEKGLDISISEKSLKAQRQELLNQGKMEEAELLNRTPAPHLGNAYKNPAILERIMEKIDETDFSPEINIQKSIIDSYDFSSSLSTIILQPAISHIRLNRILGNLSSLFMIDSNLFNLYVAIVEPFLLCVKLQRILKMLDKGT